MKKVVTSNGPTIRKMVCRQLTKNILSGEIGPGERLVETRIARQMGTSRTPVREALHILEMEKLIELKSRTGYTVKVVDNREADELWEIWFLLEDLALRWAMRKARPRLIKELNENIEIGGTAISEGNFRDFMEADIQFHEIIGRLSGEKRLCELCRTMRHHILRYRVDSIYVADVAVGVLKGHYDILKAVQNEGGKHISQALLTHLRESVTDIFSHEFWKEPFVNQPKSEKNFGGSSN